MSCIISCLQDTVCACSITDYKIWIPHEVCGLFSSSFVFLEGEQGELANTSQAIIYQPKTSVQQIQDQAKKPKVEHRRFENNALMKSDYSDSQDVTAMFLMSLLVSY